VDLLVLGSVFVETVALLVATYLIINRRRLEAGKLLRELKGDEAYQEWLRQLRDQVYVELRLEER
jgi:hypothetical protein